MGPSKGLSGGARSSPARQNGITYDNGDGVRAIVAHAEPEAVHAATSREREHPTPEHRNARTIREPMHFDPPPIVGRVPPP
jgi:hypothetical protein